MSIVIWQRSGVVRAVEGGVRVVDIQLEAVL
jgi:hypothetical protein